MKTGWAEVGFCDVCDFTRGLTYKKSDEVNFSSNSVLRANNVDRETGSLNLSEIKYIRDDIVIPEVKRVTRNSILICTASGSKSHLGKAAFVDTDDAFAYGGFMGLIQPNQSILPKLLFWFMRSNFYWDYIDALSDGANINNLKFSQLSKLRIPLPPPQEQRRIVAVLDKAFAALDRARIHSETNLKNARELFDRVSAKLFNEATDGCEPRPLGEYAAFRNGLNFSQHSSGQEIRILGVGDFQNHFYVPFKGLKTVRMEGDLSQADHIQAGDIFAVRSNGNRELIGRVLLADRTDENASFSGFTIRIRINSSDLDPQYLCHYLKSADARKRLVAGGGGANISNLNQKILSNLTLGVPDHAQQQAFVVAMENLIQQTQKITNAYQDKLSDIEDLRQSLLQKAFSGELT